MSLAAVSTWPPARVGLSTVVEFADFANPISSVWEPPVKLMTLAVSRCSGAVPVLTTRTKPEIEDVSLGTSMSLMKATSNFVTRGAASMGGAASIGGGAASIGGGDASIGGDDASIGGGAASIGGGDPSIGGGDPSIGGGDPSIGVGMPSIAIAMPSIGIAMPSIMATAPSD